MGKLMQKLLGKNKRQKLTVLAVMFIIYVLTLSGIFSYFQGSDAVTNRMTAKQGSVTVQEPKWDTTGQYKAKASEPGMQIEKDPSGYNNGEVDLYVRLIMTVELQELTDDEKAEKTDAYRGQFLTEDNKTRRLREIVKHIRLEDESEFLTLDTTAGDESAWSISGCNNPKFWFDRVNQSKTDDKLVLYFYYTDGESTPNTTMAVVKPQNKTANLFDHIDIPIYKADYLGVFDQPYTITIQAQGIPAGNYPDGLKVDDAINNGVFNG